MVLRIIFLSLMSTQIALGFPFASILKTAYLFAIFSKPSGAGHIDHGRQYPNPNRKESCRVFNSLEIPVVVSATCYQHNAPNNAPNNRLKTICLNPGQKNLLCVEPCSKSLMAIGVKPHPNGHPLSSRPASMPDQMWPYFNNTSLCLNCLVVTENFGEGQLSVHSAQESRCLGGKNLREN